MCKTVLFTFNKCLRNIAIAFNFVYKETALYKLSEITSKKLHPNSYTYSFISLRQCLMVVHG